MDAKVRRGRSRALFVVAIATGTALVGASTTIAAGAPAPPVRAAAAKPRAAKPKATSRTHGKRLYPTVAVANSRRAAAAAAAASTHASAESTGEASGAVSGGRLEYGGGQHGVGVTTGKPRVYLVFWGSQWGAATPAGSTNFANDPAGVAPRLQALFSGLGTNNELWSGVMTQYCEGIAQGASTCGVGAGRVGYPTGGPLAGIWNDTGAAAPTIATAHQIGIEAVNAAAHFANTTPASNRDAQYVIVSATHTFPDGFPAGGFCAWHDYTGDSYLGGPVASPYGALAFTNLPYVPDAGAGCGANFVNAGAAGTLDGVTIVEGHEYAETITDQFPAGGWFEPTGGENGDKCAWIKPGTAGGAANVSLATGSFAMQSTWSNDGSACRMTHAIVGQHLPDDFGVRASLSSAFIAPGSSVKTMIATATIAGAAQNLTLSVSGVPPGTTATFAPSSLTSGASSTLTFTTVAGASKGHFPLTITAAGAVTHTTTLALTVGTPPPALGNGVPVTGISGATGTDQVWQITVPPGEASLTVKTTSTDPYGDADLTLLQGDVPTNFNYDCASGNYHSNETCAVPSPAPGTWYVRVNAYYAFSNLTLTATHPAPNDYALRAVPTSGFAAAGDSVATAVYADISSGLSQPLSLSASGLPAGTTATFVPAALNSGGSSVLKLATSTTTTPGTYPITVTGTGSVTRTATYPVTIGAPAKLLTSGVTVTGLSGGPGSQQYFKLVVPPGQIGLTATITGGTGDAIMYQRRGSYPTPSNYECEAERGSARESCLVYQSPSPGPYYFMVQGVTNFSAVTLTVTYRASDFMLFADPDTSFVAAGSSVQVSAISDALGPADQTIAMSATGLPPGTTATFRQRAMSGRAIWYLLGITTSASTPLGTYPVQVTGTAVIAGEGTVTHTDALMLTVGSAGSVTTLTKNVPLKGISGAVGSSRYFRIDVPVGAKRVYIQTSRGAGNADLYVGWGDVPTPGSPWTLCANVNAGNTGSCAIKYPTPGTFYIMIRGAAAFTGLTLRASFS